MGDEEILLVGNEEELDLTNSHLPSLNDIPLKPSLKYLDLTANRLKQIEPNLANLQHLTWLCLRQNLLPCAPEVESLQSGPSLCHLELRDNQFTEIPSLRNFTSLTYLELSYNEIRSMAPLEYLNAPRLEELYLAQNKISEIHGISQLTSLRILELGSNRIKSIQNIESLLNLQELWLGRNRITEITGLGLLSNLKRLSLQSNRITSLRGLESCTALEELYISHNGITSIEGLESLSNLRILDIASNMVSSLGSCITSKMSKLTDLWANDNAIEDLDGVESALRPVRSTLTTLYLQGNPCAKDTNYKLRMLYLIPNLEQLDDNPVEKTR